MRFEHGSHRTECLAALIVLLCCCCLRSAARSSPFRTFRQCLYLDEDVGPWEACGAQVRLRFCDAYELAALFKKEGGTCDARALVHLREQDDKAREAACRFRQLIDRYDCENANSVSWTCKDCEEAYKQWVCAMFLPQVQVEGEGVKPCRYICRLVEQRCPYFHPSVKDQYAGERVFKCIDPDIPDLESIQGVSSYGPPNRCYCPQHLGQETTDSGEAECRLLTPAQLRRNSSRRGQHRSGGAPGRPALLPTLLAVVTALLWTRTR